MRYITSDTKKGNRDSFIRLWHSILYDIILYFEMKKLGGYRNRITEQNELMKGLSYRICRNSVFKTLKAWTCVNCTPWYTKPKELN